MRYLVNFESEKDMIELSSMGIRRWKLQKALYLFCRRKGIPIHLGKRINNVNLRGSIVECILSDGSKTVGNLLFGCDGVNSVIRGCLFGKESIPTYTGITCLMGSGNFKN
jgi:salicylate hydroxylase